MPLQDLLARRITGIHPFNELPIDAEVWREAHGHHHLHRQLHAAVLHRPGIAYGLEVVVVPGEEPTLFVAPGVALDSEGRAVVLAEPVRLVLREDRLTYVTIAYEDTLDRRSAVNVGGHDRHYRLVEGRQVTATRRPPGSGCVELARVERTRPDAPVREAADPIDPADDELNLLFRTLAFPYCHADGFVAELFLLPKADPDAWKPNRAGLIALLRHANGTGFHVSYGGLFNGREREAAPPLMLYASSVGDFQPPGEEQTQELASYLQAGGTLFADASGGDEAFGASFKALARSLGASLKPARLSEATVLSAHAVFVDAPSGAVDGDLLVDEAAGVFLATSDHGAAWGARVTGAGSYERSRQSLDFGLNLLAFAAARRRRALLARLV